MERLEYDFVKKSFEKEGYVLINKKYTNSRTKLDYVCNNEHKHSITYQNWYKGRRCPYCSKETRTDKIRLNFGTIKESFEDEGYLLLDSEDVYKNNDQRLNFICPNGHNHSISWHNWNSGWRCSHCHYKKLSIIFSGDGHPQWKGGISCEPYCDAWLDKDFKESIKERDNYQCQNPDCWGTSKDLCLHHIDYDKKNCKPGNLITLCRSCNGRANKDRRQHAAWYRAIMNEKCLQIGA